MTSTSLVPANGTAIKGLDPAALSYGSGLARAALDEYISSRNWPGEQYKFSNGEYMMGFGKKAVEVRKPLIKVANIPNLMVTWQIIDARDKIKDPENGKLRYITLPVCYPFAGQRMLTEDDIKEKYGDLPMVPAMRKGDKDSIPWKRLAVFVVRDEKGETLDHMMFQSYSAFRAVAQLAADVEEQLRNRPPSLPVISFDAKRISKDGMTWYVPTFELVRWAGIKDCDMPGNVQTMVYDDGPPSSDEVIEEEPVKAPAKTPINKAAAVDVEDEDDASDVTPVRVRRRVQ